MQWVMAFFFAVVGFLGFLVLWPDACTLQPINGNVTLVFNELGKLLGCTM